MPIEKFSNFHKMKESKDQFNKIIDELIHGEVDTIDAYNDAIQFVKEQKDMPKDVADAIIKVFNMIIDDEKDHIAALKKVKENKAKEVKSV